MFKSLKNLVLSIFFIFSAHYIMVFIHIFSHTILGWSFGLINHPFYFDYLSLPLFLIDKRSIFDEMLNSGHNILTAIVAITPNFINAGLFLLFLYLISSKKIQKNRYLYNFLYWLMIMNFGQFYNVVYRVFQLPGDDFEVFSNALNISEYWIFTPGILFVIFGYIAILKYKIPEAYKVLKYDQLWRQCIFLFNNVFILFGYFGGLLYEISYKSYLNLVYPILLTILFFLICFPANGWVQDRMKKLKH